MNILFKYLRLLSLSTSGALLLSIAFAANPDIAEGTLSGKVFWFHFTILLLAFSVLFMETTVPKSKFTFSLPDGLLLLFTGLILFTYDSELDPQPEKLLFISQLTMLWFMLRAVLQTHPELRLFFMSLLICSGIFEAILGIRELYGDPNASRSLFSLSGLLFASGPFSGYIAIILPISLNYALRFHNCNKIACWEARTQLFFLGIAGTVLILIGLSGGMNRSSWLAAGISCIWVLLLRRSGWEYLKQKIRRHSKIAFAVLSIPFLAIAALPFLCGFISPERSAGRMLMWNVTTKAILEHPILGTGLGGFPVTYAKAQADYFASGKASDIERLAAGCPKFAFNEYLQMGLEFGIIGLLLFTLWIGFCLYYGLKNKQIGATGGIIALLFLAMYSYPLQLPSFWVLLIFLSVICITLPGKQQNKSPKSFPYIGMLTALVACFLFFVQRSYYEPYKEWKTLRTLSKEKSYTVAAQGYRCLYPRLSHRVEFLLEGSRCLKETGQYADAIIWMNRALQLNTDPEYYYILAECFQQLGLHKQAEKYLLECTHILPEQIETYYLLTKLYTDPSFFQPDKFRLAAYSVLTKRPVTNTKAYILMKREVSTLLKQSINNQK